MKKFLKWAMLVYNILALSFLPFFLMAFFPETSLISSIAYHFANWLTLFFAALIVPFQQYLIPQIIALILIGLYVNELRLDRMVCSIKDQLPAFWGLSLWTAFSAVYMLLTYLAMMESGSVPLS